jgi:integrase
VPILTDDEIAALLKTCAVGRGRPGVFDRTVFLGRRDEVVLRLLLDTGKGSRPRVVPFGAKTAQAVDRYLRVRALHPHARSPRLLLGQRGPMTPDGARDVLNARAVAAGLSDVHPHRFRHTFAHRWLAGGGQERDLMMLADWRSDDMPSRYAESTAVEPHDAHRRLGLGDRLGAGAGRDCPRRDLRRDDRHAARDTSPAAVELTVLPTPREPRL